MKSSIFDLYPNLEPFNHNSHFNTQLINQNWVLVNGISKKKAVYVFKAEDVLTISENEKVSETTWSIDKENTFIIETEDGLTRVKAYFKDDDILVLNKETTDDCAFFINESQYDDSLNSFEDVQKFLHDKYVKKANNIISGHEFYYIEKSKEHGPFTVNELDKKVKEDLISVYCFVRDINEYNYNKRLRIIDLIKAV